MSLLLKPLNAWLRLTERPHLSRNPVPKLRSVFETKARLFFRAPIGTTYRRETIANVPVQWAIGAGASAERTILYFHGGAYVFGSSDTHKAMAARLSWLSGWRVCLVDYRLAPEHPFPAQFDDAMAVWNTLSPKGPVILGGDSAGGGLALALHAALAGMQRAPVGCFAFSPLADMTFSGESFQRNARHDVVLPAERIAELEPVVLGNADPKDPRVSPLFAKFEGATPVWLCAGDTEILLDDTRRMANALRAADVTVSETIVRDHPHVWPIFQGLLPEATATLKQVARWINALPRT